MKRAMVYNISFIL